MLIVFAYHNFVKSYNGINCKLYIDTKYLISQLTFLKRKFANIMFLKDVFSDNFKNTDVSIAITVDDGMTNFLEAYKLFKRYQLKVTLFISSNKIGKKEYSDDLNRNISYLKTGQLLCLDKNIVDIQNHGFDHIKLTEVKNEDILDREIVKSKEILENQFKKDISIFCYPYGLYNENILNTIKNVGYKAACTTITGINEVHFNPFLIKRIPLMSYDNNNYLDKTINKLLNNRNDIK